MPEYERGLLHRESDRFPRVSTGLRAAKPTGRTCQMPVRLSKEEFLKLRDAAAEVKMGQSEFLRFFLVELFNGLEDGSWRERFNREEDQ